MLHIFHISYRACEVAISKLVLFLTGSWVVIMIDRLVGKLGLKGMLLYGWKTAPMKIFEWRMITHQAKLIQVTSSKVHLNPILPCFSCHILIITFISKTVLCTEEIIQNWKWIKKQQQQRAYDSGRTRRVRICRFPPLLDIPSDNIDFLLITHWSIIDSECKCLRRSTQFLSGASHHINLGLG